MQLLGSKDYVFDSLEPFLTLHECLQLRHTCKTCQDQCDVLLRRVTVMWSLCKPVRFRPKQAAVWNISLVNDATFPSKDIVPPALRNIYCEFQFEGSESEQARIQATFCTSLQTIHSPACHLHMTGFFSRRLLQHLEALVWLRKLSLATANYDDVLSLHSDCLPPNLELLHLKGLLRLVGCLPKSLKELQITFSRNSYNAAGGTEVPVSETLECLAIYGLNDYCCGLTQREKLLEVSFSKDHLSLTHLHPECTLASWDLLFNLQSLVLPNITLYQRDAALPPSLTTLVVCDLEAAAAKRMLPISLQTLHLHAYRTVFQGSITHLTNLQELRCLPRTLALSDPLPLLRTYYGILPVTSEPLPVIHARVLHFIIQGHAAPKLADFQTICHIAPNWEQVQFTCGCDNTIRVGGCDRSTSTLWFACYSLVFPSSTNFGYEYLKWIRTGDFCQARLLDLALVRTSQSSSAMFEFRCANCSYRSRIGPLAASTVHACDFCHHIMCIECCNFAVSRCLYCRREEWFHDSVG